MLIVMFIHLLSMCLAFYWNPGQSVAVPSRIKVMLSPIFRDRMKWSPARHIYSSLTNHKLCFY
jgi:hypothetical protein